MKAQIIDEIRKRKKQLRCLLRLHNGNLKQYPIDQKVLYQYKATRIGCMLKGVYIKPLMRTTSEYKNWVCIDCGRKTNGADRELSRITKNACRQLANLRNRGQ